MKNFVQRGETITLVAPSVVASGDVVKVGDFIGVAANDADNGADVETSLSGVFSIPKEAIAISQGDTLYWDAANKVVNKTAAGNTEIGKAIASAPAGAATANVRLIG